ncbi:UNVERIFIED_CONTAM: Inpp5e [Trichonephila clavipes]
MPNWGCQLSQSYVFGSKGTSGSLLGSEELQRFFPDNQITIFVGTWNMNSHRAGAKVMTTIFFLEDASLVGKCDIYRQKFKGVKKINDKQAQGETWNRDITSSFTSCLLIVEFQAPCKYELKLLCIDPPANIDDFLLPLDINTLPDIYVIGIQESMQSRDATRAFLSREVKQWFFRDIVDEDFKKLYQKWQMREKLEWEVLLQTTLGPSHVLFTSSSLGVLHLCIFLRRDLIWFCSEPEEASVTTRPGSMVKTKGAVAVCFMLFGTSFLFVNSHLTAHEQKLKERLSDYEKIISSIDLPKSIPLLYFQKQDVSSRNTRMINVTSKFDCVFWCGDLNFRVIHDRPSVLSFVEEKVRRSRPSCSFLVKHDQLHQAMTEGRAFHGFKEGVICFIPSYKFDVGTSTFNSSKLRVPSYTVIVTTEQDRILYRSKDKSAISCLHYNAVSDILTSDHKPVYAVFKVAVKAGRDNVPLAAGKFRRDVYLEALKRRSKFLEVRHNQGQSAICSIISKII